MHLISGTPPRPRHRLTQPRRDPVVIAHRGASGYRPEHTLAAYRLAIRLGTDYIEPDLVVTADGVLVARHENEISQTTDVARRPELAARRTTKVVDDREVTGWFTEDLTLAELRSLRAVERLPADRPGNTRYDGFFQVPTFAEVLDLAEREGRRRGAVVGVYPETKHPAHFTALGLAPEPRLLAELRRRHLDRPGTPVVVQSFDPTSLRLLAEESHVPLVQLVGAADPRLLSPAGLADIASYADGIGPEKSLVLPGGQPSDLVGRAHAHDLLVHVWTLRAEERFRTPGLGLEGPSTPEAEVQAYLDAGVDGVFTDHPDVAVRVRGAGLLSPAGA
ncbi:MAG: glycerophosphodiester phosphodiesterase family protein [Nocardioides sp.]|nr:glycerophosphodiester phosphodiesterase family protein [Nocardioides sp.]